MKSNAPTVHIISHTHWDREWFLPARYTREWLVAFAEGLFALLDRDPSARFVLDGQTILIEDYLETLAEAGGDNRTAEDRLKTFVREGRIAVGPYYQQPDWQIPGGEALVRNLLIGGADSTRLGAEPMRVGWLLDNFGQSSQTVQIHASFGIQGIFFWRGADLPPHLVRTEVRWESPDGSVLPCVYLIDSYRNGMRLLSEPTLTVVRVRTGMDRLSPFATGNHVLLMNGYDQETEPEDIASLLALLRAEGIDARQDLPADFLESVSSTVPAQAALTGRQFSGRYISVFPGVLSSRTYLKVMNFETETLLQRYLEPVCLLYDSPATPYPREKLEALWRRLLRNHPHDSICGVSVDPVHADMEHRFQTVQETGRRVLLETASSGNGADEGMLVFNPHAHLLDTNLFLPANEAPQSSGPRLAVGEAKQETETGLLVHLASLPALGVARLARHVRAPGVRVTVDEGRGVMRSGSLEVVVHADGTVDVVDLESGTVHRGLNLLRDGGDAGDTYTYSPPSVDAFVSPDADSNRIHFVELGPLRATARIEIELHLPASLVTDRSVRSDTTVMCPVVLSVTLEAGMPVVQFRLRLRNRVRDHRLQVLFPLPPDSDEQLLVETQFNVEEQPIDPPEYVGAIPPELARLMIGAREPQRATSFAQQRFVDIPFAGRAEDDAVWKRGLAVINAGLPEGEIVRDEKGHLFYALTLLRSVGWLARGDVATRTGDAGPAIRTPGAQCLRDLEFRYALYPHNGSWEDARVRAVADRFLVPPVAFEGQYVEGNLLTVDSRSDSIACESIRLGGDGAHMVARLYNESKRGETARLRFGVPVQTVYTAGLGEAPRGELTPNADGSYTLSLPSKHILTVIAVRNTESRERAHGSVRHGPFPDRGEGTPRTDDLLADSLSGLNRRPPEEYFEHYPLEKEVTAAMIREEERRVRSLRNEHRRALRSYGMRFAANPGRTSAAGLLDRERLLLRSTVSTLKRAMLEAELSLLYLKEYRRRRGRVNSADDGPELAAELRRIGLELNHARIAKRVDDYLREYFAAPPNSDSSQNEVRPG